MGRRNKDNHPYLVFRKDNGTPTYYRVFPERLRPHLKGQVLGHKGKSLAVKPHQPSIRVALPNGCEKDRLDGWAKVHDQVENIVRQASAELMKLSKALVAVNAIAPEQHLQMLDQLRHGILAADDRSRTRPNELSSTAEVMKAVLGEAEHPVPGVRELQQRAQDVAHREAGRNVKADDPQILDRDGEEGEVNVDPQPLDMLTRLSRILDPKGIKLDPEMNERFNGKLSRGGAIASDVTALLARNGMTLPEGHEDRLRLALDIPRVQADAYAVVEARRNGGTTLTPPRPAPIQMPVPPSPTLFRTIDRCSGGQLTDTPLTQRDAHAIIRRRAEAAGIKTKIGNHTFRATGITAYLKNGGTLEKAAVMANHVSTRTTQLYDRRRDDVSLDEVERVAI